MASTGNFSSTMHLYIHEEALIFLITQHGKCTRVNISGIRKIKNEPKTDNLT
jgi:hypothetical protein